MTPADASSRASEVLGRRVLRSEPLSGGQIGRVARLHLAGGGTIVAKRSPGVSLTLEAAMLGHLRTESALPLPAVLHADDDLLLLEDLPGDGHHDVGTARHLAELLADLHTRPAPAFGFPYDTLLGPYPQANGHHRDWPAFFRDLRLEPLLQRARESGHLPARDDDRCRAALARVPDLLDHQPAPALIHGDLWSGNVLSAGGRVSGILDPAIYWADPEVELAYLDLFGGFGKAFFARYHDLRPIAEDFWARRRWLYQLYPLLVHVALFGAGYLPLLRERLSRLEA